MTGSIDTFACRYAAVAINQAHRVEILAEPRKMAEQLLRQYIQATAKHPRKIIYFRDGVSESQFEDILRDEVQGIRQAICEIFGSTQASGVKITVIIVQKRHHTRFFPQRGERNVLPGTVVDGGITHPVNFDFCTFLALLSLIDSHGHSQRAQGHSPSCSLLYLCLLRS